MTPSDHQGLQDIRRDTALEPASRVTPRVRPLLRQRGAAALDPWREACLTRGMPELVQLASGLPPEHSAVQAALTLPDRHGHVDGQITTVTLLKRQRDGRAKLTLLCQRMRPAASWPSPPSTGDAEEPTFRVHHIR